MKRLNKILAVVFLIYAALFSAPTTVSAAIPHLFSYEGRFTDKDGKPLEGLFTITFRIYDAETGGALLWQESQQINIQKGIVSALIGSAATLDLPFDKPYYLELKVGDELMSPRQRMASAAYAMTAETISDTTLLVPQGLIAMWSGSAANIPAGWALCDGTNGTPDLRNRFIIGAGSSYSIGTAGGSSDHSHGTGSYAGPSHTHSVPASSPIWGLGPKKDAALTTGQDGGASAHTDAQTSSSGSGAITGTSSSASSLPPYYALAYIMKL